MDRESISESILEKDDLRKDMLIIVHLKVKMTGQDI